MLLRCVLCVRRELHMKKSLLVYRQLLGMAYIFSVACGMFGSGCSLLVCWWFCMSHSVMFCVALGDARPVLRSPCNT